MRNALSYVIGLCLALWLGGITMLLITVMSVFKVRHDLGQQIGPIVFNIYERYQLALAAIAIACTIAWRLYSCSKPKKMMLACIMGATILGMVSFAYVTPQISEIWNKKQEAMDDAIRAIFTGATTQPIDPEGIEQDRFKSLHTTSRYLYTGVAVLVLLAGGAFVSAVRGDSEIRPGK